MDTREFVEIIRSTDFALIVRVGYWFHMLDRETGEGKWEWHGPEKRRPVFGSFYYPSQLRDPARG